MGKERPTKNSSIEMNDFFEKGGRPGENLRCPIQERNGSKGKGTPLEISEIRGGGDRHPLKKMGSVTKGL